MFEENSNSTSNGQIAILDEVLAFQQEIFEHRRWFHAHPELSFQEIQTAAKVVELLRNIGIDEIWEGVGRTGVVALIRGGKPGKCVALRADMDALPIQETSDLPFRSQNDGAMHACGHDGHMAGLLAAAKVLYAERELLSGIVKLIFQPAEEGYAGAPEMIKDGCLEDGPMGPNVDEIYGLHLWSCQSSLPSPLLWSLPLFTPRSSLCSHSFGRDRL
jgi:amidohydrolase